MTNEYEQLTSTTLQDITDSKFEIQNYIREIGEFHEKKDKLQKMQTSREKDYNILQDQIIVLNAKGESKEEKRLQGLVGDLVRDISAISKNISDFEGQIAFRESDIKSNLSDIKDLEDALGIKETEVLTEITQVNTLKEEIDTKIDEKVNEVKQITNQTSEEKRQENIKRKQEN